MARPALIAALLLPALAAPTGATAQATTGGTIVPPTATAGEDGGAAYGELPKDFKGTRPKSEEPRRRPDPRPRRRRASRDRGPVLGFFQLNRPRLFLDGHSAQVRFRIDARARRVRVHLIITRRGGGPAVVKMPLGLRRTGTTHSVPLKLSLPEGAYTVRISARDRRGRGLGRSARTLGARDLDFFHHRFPVVGTFSLGGPDSRFGAPRRGHTHQGQDITAAEGTPVVAPRGGVVKVVQYQASGAGHYVVVSAVDEGRDYVFMHLRTGSIPVQQGQHVRTGQRVGEVGTTGSSSGPHLHFEVWVGGWFERGGQPIDPLPLLRAWAGGP